LVVSRVRRALPIITSLALIALSLWAGFAALPTPRTLHPAFSKGFEADAGLDFWLQRTSLVFVFEDDFHPRQCGTAQVASDQTLLMAPYTSDKCHASLQNAEVVSLHPVGLRLLWSLIPEADRADITAEGWDLTQQMTRPFLNVLNSPYFKEHYRDELSRTLQDALRLSWMSPRVQAAWLEIVNSLNPVYTTRLIDHLWPIAVEKTKAGLLNSLTDLGQALLQSRDQPRLVLKDDSLISRILQDLLTDPRSQALLFETLMQVSSDPKVASFVNLFASEILLALMADPHLPALLDSIAMDPLLLSQSQQQGFNFDFLTQTLPRKLLRYRYPRDHNPLVAYLVRSILRGDNTFVVLLMTQEQTAMAAKQGMSPGISLRATTP
jgi:hypothetical protein